MEGAAQGVEVEGAPAELDVPEEEAVSRVPVPGDPAQGLGAPEALLLLERALHHLELVEGRVPRRALEEETVGEDEPAGQGEVAPVGERPAGVVALAAQGVVDPLDQELGPGAPTGPHFPVPGVPHQASPDVVVPALGRAFSGGRELLGQERGPPVSGSKIQADPHRARPHQDPQRRLAHPPLEVRGDAHSGAPVTVVAGVGTVLGVQRRVVGNVVAHPVVGRGGVALHAREGREAPPRGQEVGRVEEEGQLPPAPGGEAERGPQGEGVGRIFSVPVDLDRRPVAEALVRVVVHGRDAGDLPPCRQRVRRRARRGFCGLGGRGPGPEAQGEGGEEGRVPPGKRSLGHRGFSSRTDRRECRFFRLHGIGPTRSLPSSVWRRPGEATT